MKRKTRSFENATAEAERCLAQSKKFRDQKVQFEDEIFKKVCSGTI